MRYIYVDEAGTSANEPVSVVVGIITKPDADLLAVRKEMRLLLELVPSQHRNGFHFHAKDVWGHPRYREGWSKMDRLKLISRFAQLPVKLGLAISVGKVRRDAPWPPKGFEKQHPSKMTQAQWHHALAFSDCAVQADTYLRERCEEGEIATLIAEDIPEMRRNLRTIFEVAKILYFPLSAEFLRPTIDEKKTGRIVQRPIGGISRIQDGVQFAEKRQAPLLQIADACAFSLRRFFSQQEYGVELVQAMGLQLNIEDWLGPQSSQIFCHEPILRSDPYSYIRDY